ncbi:MAG TPA: hypothetical protein VH496_14385 [Mycobacterium sp.]
MRFRFETEVITVAMRWKLRYAISYRDVELPSFNDGVAVTLRDRTSAGVAIEFLVYGLAS